MVPPTPPPKHVRFAEFIRRLTGLPNAASDVEARRVLAETLNQVEDELSGVPYDPRQWRTDGRMYPPQDDSAADVPNYPSVTSYRSRRHETSIAKNGAFEIRDLDTGETVIAKKGLDGKGVWA